jgi:hypothetical protein
MSKQLVVQEISTGLYFRKMNPYWKPWKKVVFLNEATIFRSEAGIKNSRLGKTEFVPISKEEYEKHKQVIGEMTQYYHVTEERLAKMWKVKLGYYKSRRILPSDRQIVEVTTITAPVKG